MLAVLILIAVVAAFGGLVGVVLGNHRRYDEVERFHRASRMTTEWARHGITQPLIAQQETPVDERTRSDA